jgi:hypothetical protein
MDEKAGDDPMTETKPNRSGIKFLIAFLTGIIIVVIACSVTFTAEETAPLIIAATLLILSSIAAFICRQFAIGSALLTALITSPFIFFGSCLMAMKDGF